MKPTYRPLPRSRQRDRSPTPLRWWIFQAASNGLADAGAIVRVQRRVYVDVDKFERWIDTQNQQAPVAA